MEKKGLCGTCDNDKICIFQTRFPVLQCEEFVNTDHKLTTAKRPRKKKVGYLQEVTVEE